MARKTGTRRALYWSAAKTTIHSLSSSGTADPVKGDLSAGTLFGAAADTNLVGRVTTMPDFGSTPNTVLSEEYDEPDAIQVDAQGQPQDATIIFTVDTSNANMKALERLPAGAAITVAIFSVEVIGSGTGRASRRPGATGVKGVWRIMEGTKNGDGLNPGGTVNDLESYQLPIAVARRLRVDDL